MNPLLDVEDLAVSFATYAGEVKAVNRISFHISQGEAVGLVGESGCGKSVTAHALMQLVTTPPGKYTHGKIMFEDTNLLQVSEPEMEEIRGNKISMIFQDPMTSLNPVLTVGKQIAESLQWHKHRTSKEAYTQTVELLRLVGISSPEQRIRDYPHQFSGGMRQRAMIAMALACNPKLLIADEPTTALDVTIQAQILSLLKELQAKMNMSILFISHDLGAIAGLCSRVLVMYAGSIMEAGTAAEIFYARRHPYTLGLLKSLPRLHEQQKQKLAVIAGQPPDLLYTPSGCPFHPRCPHAMKICREYAPETIRISESHTVSCWLQHPSAPQREVPSVE